MSLAIIEINDSGHCCGNEMGEIFISPGYAFLTNDGIETGEQGAATHAGNEPPRRWWRDVWRRPLPRKQLTRRESMRLEWDAAALANERSCRHRRRLALVDSTFLPRIRWHRSIQRVHGRQKPVLPFLNGDRQPLRARRA